VYNENVCVNMNVCQAAAELGVKKIVFASTIQVIAVERRYPEDEGMPSSLTYLPLDGDSPANPRNTYALSKWATENMLEYYARRHGLDCVAIRFPYTFDRRYFETVSKRASEDAWHGYAIEEAFSYLSCEDASRLIAAILRADLPGFRVYFPAAASPFLTVPIGKILQRFFPGVPLRRPLDQLGSLVDTSRIERETGWRPQDCLQSDPDANLR